MTGVTGTAGVAGLAAAARTTAPCALAEVLAAAELQTRVDRKYLVPPEAFARLADGLATSHRVLEVGGLRVFRYESVYFDTPSLESYLGAARGRRRRFKVRTRTYLDSGACLLEVQRAGGRGQTIKERADHPVGARTDLGDHGRAFVAERIALPHVDVDTLEPLLTTTYRRMTLVDLDSGSRVTCDAGLRLTDPTGRSAGMSDHVLVESKSAGSAGSADRLLWHAGIRPARISKYAVGMAALRPDLPANRWHRVLRDHFDCRRDALTA